MPGQRLSDFRSDPRTLQAGDEEVPAAVKIGVQPGVIPVGEEVRCFPFRSLFFPSLLPRATSCGPLADPSVSSCGSSCRRLRHSPRHGKQRRGRGQTPLGHQPRLQLTTSSACSTCVSCRRLAERRLHGGRRRIGVQVERPFCQAADLAPAESGPGRRRVHHGADLLPGPFDLRSRICAASSNLLQILPIVRPACRDAGLSLH